jgi:hypothetical protein
MSILMQQLIIKRELEINAYTPVYISYAVRYIYIYPLFW